MYGVDDGFPGQFEAQFKAGANCAQMDPIVMVSAMLVSQLSVLVELWRKLGTNLLVGHQLPNRFALVLQEVLRILR